MPQSLNIMVVEDHDALREVTVEALRKEGHSVRGLDCAEAWPDEAGAWPVDLIVLDLNLPGEDGIALANRLRKVQPKLGIIMVTARAQAHDRMLGYDSGADIYLTKPTSTEELLAAVRALARRIRPERSSPSAFTLDLSTMSLQGPSGQTELSDHEVAQILAFVRAKEQELESWQLISLTDKPFTTASKKALEVQLVRLRKKLQQVGATGPTIKAIRGQGYRLCLQVSIRGD